MSIYLAPEPPDVVYYHRLYALAGAVCELCDEVFAETSAAETQEHYRRASPDIHAKIDALLSAAANIKKMVRTSSTKRKGESDECFAFRKRRAAVLSKLLEPAALSEVLKSEARNSVEHFEEWLDELIAGALTATRLTRKLAGYNLVCHRLDLYPLKVYVASERRYYNMRASIDLQALRTESKRILERLRETEVLGSYESAGALLIPLPLQDDSAV